MIYLAWAAMHEGATDKSYFDIIIPLLMEDLVRTIGTCEAVVPQSSSINFNRSGRSVADVAKDICDEKDAFHIVFIHADTGGRALEADMDRRSKDYQDAAFELCGFPIERCIIIAPRHETEAWMLADQAAVGSALGYRGDLSKLGLPKNAKEAERIVDPKDTLTQAIAKVRGRRSMTDPHQLISAIAQRQRLDQLRLSDSFQRFEYSLRAALKDLGCIA